MQNNEVHSNAQIGAQTVAAEQEYYVIDIVHILKALLNKAWLLILVSIITAAAGFAYSSFYIAPKYSSAVLLYVNNSSLSLGGTSFSISSSEITAAQSLAKTYMVLLDNRTTLEAVIEKADLPYTTKQLSSMISSESVNSTEVLRIKVTSENAQEAAKIANAIAEVLPGRIQEIINGSSMVVVDSAVPDYNKVSPSVTKYTAMGLLLGFIVTAAIIAVFAYMDDTIHSQDYLVENLSFPILAVIPDLTEQRGTSYAYRHKTGSHAGSKE